MFCPNCGSNMPGVAYYCTYCGTPLPRVYIVQSGKSRVAYVLLGVFLGGLGVHNFYAGYVGRAVSQLLITLLLGWLVVPAIGVFIWVIIEVCTISHDSQGVPFI